jgi:hypothetical protein
MTATLEAGLRPLIPEDIAKIVIAPKSYTNDDVIYPAFKWLRENMPLGVAEVDGYDPIWIVTKHADIRAIELNAKLFHNADHNPILNDRASDAFMRQINGGSTRLISSLTYMDPPEHAAYRNLTQTGSCRGGSPGWKTRSVCWHARASTSCSALMANAISCAISRCIIRCG